MRKLRPREMMSSLVEGPELESRSYDLPLDHGLSPASLPLTTAWGCCAVCKGRCAVNSLSLPGRYIRHGIMWTSTFGLSTFPTLCYGIWRIIITYFRTQIWGLYCWGALRGRNSCNFAGIITVWILKELPSEKKSHFSTMPAAHHLNYKW